MLSARGKDALALLRRHAAKSEAASFPFSPVPPAAPPPGWWFPPMIPEPPQGPPPQVPPIPERKMPKCRKPECICRKPECICQKPRMLPRKKLAKIPVKAQPKVPQAVLDRRASKFKMAPRWHQGTVAPRALRKNKKVIL
jgi:hypothetical protein